MSDLALDSSHDLDVTNQALSLVEDEEDSPAAIAQEIKIGLLFHRGEWPLNVLVGIPYREQVLRKNPALPAIATLYTRAIRSVPGVIDVPALETEFDNENRQLSIDWEARAQNGGVIQGTTTVPFVL